MRNYTETKSTTCSDEYAKYRIQFEEHEGDKEKVLLVIERCPDGCMPIWVKHGYFKKAFAWWNVTVYATDKDGNCWGRYNPQEKLHITKNDKGEIIEHRNVVNFNWVLPATEENKQKIIAEVSRLAFKED